MTQQEINMLIIGGVLFLIVLGIALFVGFIISPQEKSPQEKPSTDKNIPIKPKQPITDNNKTQIPSDQNKDQNKNDQNKQADVNIEDLESDIEDVETDLNLITDENANTSDENIK